MIEIREDAVLYQAKTRLEKLAFETASTKNLKKVEDKIRRCSKIIRFCRALEYGDYLTAQQRGKIVRTLVYLAGINDFPVAPTLGSIDPPSVLTGIPGRDGEQGPQGPEGGGVPFSATNVTQDTVCDSFAITESRGAEWQINIYGTDSNGDPAQRTMRIIGGWTADGTNYGDDGGDGTEFYGDTSEIAISVVVLSGTARLFAAVTGGEWTVEGTRKHIPNNGSGIVNPTTLASGRIWVGNASNTPTAVTPTGDVTIATNGTTSISPKVIVNADISDSAAISVSKLAALTASRAVVTDANGHLTTTSVAATQVGYLANVTSDVQAQLDSKLSAANGAISTVVNTNLTADRAVISNPSGKISVSAVTASELSVLDGITATTTELNYCDGVTSSIQDQLNNRVKGSGLNVAVLSIGDWNMDANQVAIVDLTGTTTWDKVRSISTLIRRDDDAVVDEVLSDLSMGAQTTDWERQGIAWASGDGVLTSNGIVLQRKTGGYYDSSSYDKTSFNRGYVTITFID